MSKLDPESLMFGWKVGRMVAMKRGGISPNPHVFNPETGTLVILKDNGSCSYLFDVSTFELNVTEEVFYG